MRVKIVPIPEPFLERVRAHGVDDLGQPVKRFRSAQGGEPCRDVLRRAAAGDELILASFCPFTKPGPYKEFGPIFVLADASPEATIHDRLPLSAGAPRDYFLQQLTLRAYSRDQEILDAAIVTRSEADATVERFFQSPAVSFVDARFPATGCFACRIQRED